MVATGIKVYVISSLVRNDLFASVISLTDMISVYYTYTAVHCIKLTHIAPHQ